MNKWQIKELMMDMNSNHIIRILGKYALFVFLLLVTEIDLLRGQGPVSFALLTDLHVNPGSFSDSSLNRVVDGINNLFRYFLKPNT